MEEMEEKFKLAGVWVEDGIELRPPEGCVFESIECVVRYKKTDSGFRDNVIPFKQRS